MHDYHDNQRNHGQRKRQKGDEDDGSAAGRELALNDPSLALGVAVVA